MSCFVQVFTIITFLVHLTRGEHGCRTMTYLPCIKNKRFYNHLISTTTVLSLEHCQSMCFRVNDCVSYNIASELNGQRTCELSSSDHRTFPESLKDHSLVDYCPIKNSCSSTSCTQSKPLCYPDYSWGNYTCRDGIWSEWSGWSLCFCPNKIRTRKCQNNQGQAAEDCGPGPNKQAVLNNLCLTSDEILKCSGALGMIDGRIQDKDINASSYHSLKHCRPSFGRLYRVVTALNYDSSWCAASRTGRQYLQVNLGRVRTVTKIATQGRNINHKYQQFVTKYSLSYSTDGKLFSSYCTPEKIFEGNRDTNSVVTNDVYPPLKGQWIRVIVKAYNEHPSMRMELYGC